MTTQRAVVTTGDGGVDVAEVEFTGLRVPRLPGLLRHGEALPHGAVVRVLATGICGSDLHTLTNPRTAPGQVCGHEAAGVVAEVGADVASVHVGDTVVVPFNVGCGRCASCRHGKTAHCGTTNPYRPGATYGMGPDLGGWMGVQSEYALVPYADANLYWVGDQDWAQEHVTELVLIADLLPTGYHAALRTGVTGGDSVYVAGAGPVGLATAMCLRILYADRVVVGDPREERRRRAADLGFTVVDPGTGDLAAALHETIGTPEVSATVDCVGLAGDGPAGARVLDQLIGVTRTNGTVVLTGVYPSYTAGERTSPPVWLGGVWTKALTLRAGVTPAGRYQSAVEEHLRRGTLAASDFGLVTAALDRAPALYDAFARGAAGKFVLTPERMGS